MVLIWLKLTCAVGLFSLGLSSPPEILSSAGFTILGAATILAVITSLLFTTASEAMVAPKLKFGHEEFRTFSSYVRTHYANFEYVDQICKNLQVENESRAGTPCLMIQLQLESNLDWLTYIQTSQGHDKGQNLTGRPTVSRLIGNTTLESSWMDTQYSDTPSHFGGKRRIINNVTLAWSHPGVASAATSEMNGILQPTDLGGIGRYVIKAQVMSPVINALCVDMGAEELAPIVYTSWPNARSEKTGVDNQTVGPDDWHEDVPGYEEDDGEWLNVTVVDDVFRWGQKYGRRPPIFHYYPSASNLIDNAMIYPSDAAYLLGKRPDSNRYTLCELRSLMVPKCYTQYQTLGVSGSSMQVVCSNDPEAPTYQNSWPADTSWPTLSGDWMLVANSWMQSLGFIAYNDPNAEPPNSILLTHLALNESSLPRAQPSLAESLVVLASTTVLQSVLDASFSRQIDPDLEIVYLNAPGKLESFNATIQTHKYTSGHVDKWQRMFYVILGLAFAINLFCLATFAVRRGLVTDITEPQNTFMVALNGTPSNRLKGTFESGLTADHLVMPWRVVPIAEGNDYKIVEVLMENGG